MIHNRNKIIFFITLLSGFFVPSKISSMHRILRLCSDDTVVDGVFVPGARGVTTINVTNHNHVPADGHEAPRARSSSRSSAKVVPLDFEGISAYAECDDNAERGYQSQVRVDPLDLSRLKVTPVTSPRRVAKGGAGSGATASPEESDESPRGRTAKRCPKAPRGSPRYNPRTSPVIYSPRTRDSRRSLRAPHQRVRFDDAVTELDSAFPSPITAAARAARERRHTTGGRPPRATQTMTRLGSLEITDLDSATSPRDILGRKLAQGPDKSSSHRRYEKTDSELYEEQMEIIFEKMAANRIFLGKLRIAYDLPSLRSLVVEELNKAQLNKRLERGTLQETYANEDITFLNEALDFIKADSFAEAKHFLQVSYNNKNRHLADDHSAANTRSYLSR